MIRDNIAAQLTKSLTPAAIKTLVKDMVSYVDANSEILLSLDLSNRYSFADKDRAIVYTAMGLSEADMIEQIKLSKQINKSNKIQSNPFYISCILLMNRLIQLKDDKTARMIITYMSLMMYTSIHKGFFKYKNNKQIMDYTIAHLDNSYRIREMNSLYAFLQDNADVAYNTYLDRIKRADDTDLTYVVDALWVRIKGKMRKIANAFYKNYEQGNYLNADTSSYDEENYHELDNDSFAIERLVTKVFIKLLNHQYDDRFIKYAITRSDVSYQKLKNLINDIIDDDDQNRVRSYLSTNIEYFLHHSGKGFEYISRGEFISYMKSIYTSNSDNEQLKYIKDTLEAWLTEHMISAGRTNYGRTAKINYKKSLFMFFVFVINYNAK